MATTATATTTTTTTMPQHAQFKKTYSWIEPSKTDPPLRAADHFSSLLFGGSVADTMLEISLLSAPVAAVLIFGAENVDVPGSMPLSELAIFFCVASVVRRVYNAYLEAVWFSFPEYRTQPAKEHKLKGGPKDLCGREL